MPADARSRRSGGATGAAATTGASVLRGTGWAGLSLVFPHLYTLVISVAAARFLGPELMGRQSFIWFVQLSATLLLAGGFPLALSRFVGTALGGGRAPDARGLVRWAWLVQAPVAGVGIAVLGLVALLGSDPPAAWALAAAICGLAILHNVPSAFLFGAQRFRQASVVGVTTGAFSTVATVAVLWAGGGITGMFVVGVVVALVNLVWTAALAQRTLRELAPRAEASPVLRQGVVRYAAASSIGVVLTFVVWRRSEFFFLERFSDDAEIAFYSIAFSALTFLSLIPQAIGSTIGPAFATLYGAGDLERMRTGYSRAARLAVIAALPLTAATLALGPAALRIVYGREYDESGDVLLILSSVLPVVSIWAVSSSLVFGLGRILWPNVIGAGAAALDIALALLLVPRYGATGAAGANAIAQLAVSVPLILYARSAIGGVDWRTGALARTAAAAAAAGIAGAAAVAAIDGAFGLLVGVTAFAAVFGLGAVALRALPFDDASWLAEVSGSRFAGVPARAVRLAAGRAAGGAS